MTAIEFIEETWLPEKTRFNKAIVIGLMEGYTEQLKKESLQKSKALNYAIKNIQDERILKRLCVLTKGI